jgi:hypothetical protein
MRTRYIFFAIGILLTSLLTACSNQTQQEEVNVSVESPPGPTVRESSPTPKEEVNVSVESPPGPTVRESSPTPTATSKSPLADESLSSSNSVDMTIIEDGNYEPFNRYIDVYALRIFALDEISDEFIKAVALTYGSMLTPTEIIDVEMRQSFIDGIADANVFQRLGCSGPEFYNFEFPEEPNARKYRGDNKVDYIWQQAVSESSEGAAKDAIGEVIEHLLHTVTTVGFSNLDPVRWDTSNPNSLLNLAKEEAIVKGIYDVSSYSGIDDSNTYNAVTAQEYVYWLIAAE